MLLLALLAAQIRFDGSVFRVDGPAACDAFRVRVESPEDVPALLGVCDQEGGALVFRAKYPLQPGLRYRAEYRGVSAVFAIPKPAAAPSTVVERVFPSTDVVPENILKFYLHFSAPMSRGEAYRHIRLLDERGRPTELPFLEIDQELWDRSARRLTLLFDPGRIKRGLVPNEEVGLPIMAGKTYTLVIDAAWIDAAGLPLKQAFTKTFRAGPSERAALDPKHWKLTAPRAGTRASLTLDFPRPLDHELLETLLDVATRGGRPVQGTVDIERGETRWRFTPTEPWAAGDYAVHAGKTLEDLAGNSIGHPFDVDVFEKVEERIARETAVLEFRASPLQ